MRARLEKSEAGSRHSPPREGVGGSPFANGFTGKNTNT